VKTNNIFVFRFAIGEPGEPTKNCPISFHQQYEDYLKSNLSKHLPIELSYINYEQFLWNELFINGRLRQTWGYEGLDLEIVKQFGQKGEDFWIRNFIISQQKIGNFDEISDDKKWCEIAKGRLNILRYLLKMKKGDMVFIPKVWNGDKKNKTLENKLYFTIATIKNNYYFDYPLQIGDFGHTIEVSKVKSFEYGKYGINGDNFSPHPYRRAISIVKSDKAFREFIKEFY